MESETIFHSRLMEECKKINKSANQVERDLNYPRNSLNNYRRGRIPSGVRLVELANYFGVTPQYLIGKKEDLETSIEDRFNKLNFNKKKELYTICQEWALSNLKQK